MTEASLKLQEDAATIGLTSRDRKARIQEVLEISIFMINRKM